MRLIRYGTYFCLLSILASLCINAHAQNYTVSFLGKSDLRKANFFYKKKNYEEAAKLYSSYLAHKDEPLKAKIALANSLKQLYRTTESESWYRRAFSSNNNSIPAYCQLDFVEVLIMNGKISEANEQVKEYLVQNPADERAALLLKETSQYPSFYKDSLQYSIQPYFANSSFSDYAPAYYKNEIVFCSSRPSDGVIKHVESTNDQALSHLFTSTATNHHITTFNALNHPSKHDGPVTFWANGTKAIYCSNTDELFENGKLTLLYSEYLTKSKEWSKPAALPFTNPQFSYGHPIFDEQRSTLYFVSNLPEGLGGTDIYRVSFTEGQWSTPINLGAPVNTSGNEMYPFQSKEGVLYFASNGHTGMGGLDIFAYRSDSLGNYLTNLGYPVNSAFDDFSLVLSDTEPTGLFSSNRTGNDDIYTVKIYRIALDLDISDQLNYKPLSKCIVKVSEQETGEVKYILNSDKNGHVLCDLIPGKNYSIKIYKSGYAMKSTEFIENNREQAHVRKSIAISRTHQRYVKAKVVQQSTLLRNCEVKLLDYSSDSIMSYQADSSGSFLCQINSDTTALLYFKKNNWQGYALFNKDEDARENSGITYITVNMVDTLTLKSVPGMFHSADSMATGVPNATLYCKNRISKHMQTIQTDETGAFTAQLENFGIYDLYDKEDSPKAILSIDAATVNFIEVKKTE
ncbi:MAG: Minor outer membrane protein Omp16 [Chitinophagaceae bacterium]|nr:Minor outer membrane protein Omp16 [Chitinophagaceae bacterium]